MSVPARIDFGWIGQGWALFKEQSGVWIGAMLLCFLLDAGVWILLSIPTGVMTSMQRIYTGTYNSTFSHTPPIPSAHPYQDFARWQAQGILIGCLAAIFNGGFYRMAWGQVRGEPISVFGIFSGFSQALPLAAVGIVIPVAIGLLEATALWLLHFSLTPTAAVSAVNLVSWLPALVLPAVFMFAPVLVIDAGANTVQALVGSLDMLRGRWLMATAFYVVLNLLVQAGAVLCGLGLLAACPVFFLSLTLAYLALTSPAGDTPELDPAPVGVWPPPPRVS